jgi:hypothetical protein
MSAVYLQRIIIFVAIKVKRLTMGTILQTGYNKVIEKFFGVTVSNELYSCANTQLTAFFESKTQLKVNHKIYITWEYGQIFGYKKADISSINCMLQVGHRKEALVILWKSVSGRIYDLSDTDIDCADIIMWLDGLNTDLYRKALFPLNSLFRHVDITISSFYDVSGLVVSEAFISCADSQLTSYFEKTVGYKVNNQVSVTMVDKGSEQFIYEKGENSRLPIQIYNNHNWNPVVILWHSYSGRIYDTSDTDIDCRDIRFRFEGIDAALFQRQMYPKEQLPFKLKNLSYELIVTRLNIDCIITATLKPEAVERSEAIGKELTDLVENFNQASEAKGRKDGVVHSAYATMVDGNVLELTLNIGSAGAVFFKKLLILMSAMGNFEKVNIN